MGGWLPLGVSDLGDLEALAREGGEALHEEVRGSFAARLVAEGQSRRLAALLAQVGSLSHPVARSLLSQALAACLCDASLAIEARFDWASAILMAFSEDGALGSPEADDDALIAALARLARETGLGNRDLSLHRGLMRALGRVGPPPSGAYDGWAVLLEAAVASGRCDAILLDLVRDVPSGLQARGLQDALCLALQRLVDAGASEPRHRYALAQLRSSMAQDRQTVLL
jgi:hypothetical protein